MRSFLAALLLAAMLALSACGASSDNAQTEGGHAAHSASAAVQTQTAEASGSADDDAQAPASASATEQASAAESTPKSVPEQASSTPKPTATATPQAQHSGSDDDNGGHAGGTDDKGHHAAASHKPSPSAEPAKTASPRPTSGAKGTPSPSAAPSPSASAQDDKHGGKGGGDDEKPAAKTYVVEIADFSFTVEKLEIHPGDSVKFVNRDKVKHTATADDGSFDTGLLGQDESKTVLFEKAGEFGYYCTPHPGMRATIVVKAD